MLGTALGTHTLPPRDNEQFLCGCQEWKVQGETSGALGFKSIMLSGPMEIGRNDNA